jgi:enoyl-CoA hydratase/carnithine racemase
VAPGGPPQDLLTDLAQLGGCGSAVTELDDGKAAAPAGPGVVRVGVDRAGRLPAIDADGFDVLLTSRPAAPAPWVHAADVDAAVAALQAQIALKPVASAVCAQVLRATLQLSFDEALALESIAYSMLLASEGFRTWRNATPVRSRPEEPAARVAIEAGDEIQIRLTRPARRNAFDARMRDELADALAFAQAHPDAPPVVLSGEGPSFSAGGDLDEFGSAQDVGWAHMVRALRSPAGLVHALGERLTARVHGACVGAGIEVSAAAARLTARRGAFFRLPEVSMGLIPGAGGAASIPRRIGRHRACFMAISGADIDLPTALAWGLVDAPEEAG